MMRRVMLAMSLFAVSPVLAQTQAEMNADAAGQFRTADAQLNAAYRKLQARLSAGGQSRLRVAQRAWLAVRDRDCAFVSSGSDGGSVAPMINASCLVEETQTRTKWLARYLVCEEGDLSCPS